MGHKAFTLFGPKKKKKPSELCICKVVQPHMFSIHLSRSSYAVRSAFVKYCLCSILNKKFKMILSRRMNDERIK